MSYSTLDRHGGIKTHYSHKSGNPSAALQAKTWWPDFGPGKDHSFLPKAHPTDTIFDKQVAPKHWDATKTASPALAEKLPAQFRNPEPANHAMLHKAEPTMEVKLAAKAVTQKQAALRAAEMRQRRVDSWCGPAPIRMAASASLGGKKDLSMYGDAMDRGSALSRSEPSLGSELASIKASGVSREVYEQHGYLVGRSQGQIADGKNGVSRRKHMPLSAHSIRFGGDGTTGFKRSGPKKPSKQWRAVPESGFVFDPKTFLPVPRGGWGAQLPDKWPEPPPAGRRAFADNFEMTASTTLSGAMSGGTGSMTLGGTGVLLSEG